MASLEEALAAAREYTAAGHFAGAEGIYRQILDVYPDQPEARRGMDVLESSLPMRGLLQALRVNNKMVQDQSKLIAHAEVRSILSEPRHADPLRLERFEAKYYSQNGEDGIIAEIFRRIGTTNRTFVEFGVESGLECNSLLLLLQGWSGVWLEAADHRIAEIHGKFAPVLANGRLRLRHTMVTRDNINPILAEMRVPEALDLISIDIDGVDYYVFEALSVVRPRVVVIEYNAKLPPPTLAVIPYDESFSWNKTDYFGASLQSLTNLAERKGYRLVGCNITGSNAFFVRADLAEGRFQAPATAENFYHPPRYHLSVNAYTVGHEPDFGVYEAR